MADRSGDWFAQAQRDVSHAVDASEHEHFEWACFSSQQAAQEAIEYARTIIGFCENLLRG